MSEVRRNESEKRTFQEQFAHLSERIFNAGLLIRVGGATEKSFRKTEMLESQEEANNVPIHLYDADKKIILIHFVRRMKKKITFCSQALRRIFSATMSNHAYT